MGGVISFEQQAVASLQRKLGAAETANADLMAFARGHSGAVHAIHHAVLAAMAADSLEAALAIVCADWPQLLAIDCAAVALVVGDQGFRADRRGIERLEPVLVERAFVASGAVRIESVGHGHPLFGAEAGGLRGQALVALDAEWVSGLLLLGQRSAAPMGDRHGEQLLMFLGGALAAIIRRWTLTG